MNIPNRYPKDLYYEHASKLRQKYYIFFIKTTLVREKTVTFLYLLIPVYKNLYETLVILGLYKHS